MHSSGGALVSAPPLLALRMTSQLSGTCARNARRRLHTHTNKYVYFGYVNVCAEYTRVVSFRM
jgi:hypothetical protein